MFLSEDTVTILLNLRFKAPACHFELFITPGEQEKEEATTILAELINTNYHEEVGLMFVMPVERHMSGTQKTLSVASISRNNYKGATAITMA